MLISPFHFFSVLLPRPLHLFQLMLWCILLSFCWFCKYCFTAEMLVLPLSKWSWYFKGQAKYKRNNRMHSNWNKPWHHSHSQQLCISAFLVCIFPHSVFLFCLDLERWPVQRSSPILPNATVGAQGKWQVRENSKPGLKISTCQAPTVFRFLFWQVN